MSSIPANPVTLDMLKGNRLLALLPEQAQRQLLPLVKLVPLELKQVLYESDRPMAAVYFPLRAVTSTFSTMEDGSTIEVATVGND